MILVLRNNVVEQNVTLFCGRVLFWLMEKNINE